MVGTMDVKMASDRQLGFLRDLLRRKAAAPSVVGPIEAQLALGMSARQASIYIDGLLRLGDRIDGPAALPTPPSAVKGDLWPKVHEGRYAIVDPEDGVLKFYQVDKPREGRWEGYTFLSVFASEQRHSVKVHDTKKRILDAIALNPEAAMRRYGLELGVCGVCGRELTDATSRAFGIGPVCRGKLGYNVKPGESVPAGSEVDSDPYEA